MIIMKKYTYFITILGILFISSGQTYEEQSLLQFLKEWFPGQPLESVLSHLQISYWGTIVSIEERGYYSFVEFLIRKASHIITFGILAIATYIMTKRYILAFLISFGIAIFDEYHQSMTIGRTATIQDVFLDAFGALLAIILIFFINRRKTKIKSSAKSKLISILSFIKSRCRTMLYAIISKC